ncbi:hypothetical protein L2E82_48314 [Cichorium intybus]|uniref:Uncharacterized protein n=1 Tax=Cichorium intybus TaxID=13427 RepID=A0ACB8YY65_CICIN|nr:hypothetical protein L2E82_48314 [Cichorium intybus]
MICRILMTFPELLSKKEIIIEEDECVDDTSVYVLLPFSQSQLKLVFFLPFSSQLFTYNTSPNLFKSLEVKKPERSNLFQRLYMGP